MTSGDELPRGVRHTLDEAERAAKIARAVVVAAIVLSAGGCFTALAGSSCVSSPNSNDLTGCEWITPIGGSVFFVGFCLMPFAVGLSVRAMSKHRALIVRSHHRPQDAEPAKWRDLPPAASPRDKPHHKGSGSPVGITRHEPKTEPEELSARVQGELAVAKRAASESLWLAVGSLLLLPVAFVTAPIAIWRGRAANRTFLQFPKHAHNYGKATAMAGITLAWVALAFAPFLFMALLSI